MSRSLFLIATVMGMAVGRPDTGLGLHGASLHGGIHPVAHHGALHPAPIHPAPHHAVGHPAVVPHAAPHHSAAHHAVPHHPAPYHPTPYHEVHHAPAHYTFDYAVHDDYSGNHFGHTESRDGYDTKGTYFVHLPDGRVQTVTYTADEYGYHPSVTYEGIAQYAPAYQAPVPHHAPAVPIVPHHAPVVHPAPHHAPIAHHAPVHPIHAPLYQ